MANLQPTIACGPFDRTQGLPDGTIRSTASEAIEWITEYEVWVLKPVPAVPFLAEESSGENIR